MLLAFSDWVVYRLLGLSSSTFAAALSFFIYDAIKILTLLWGMIFLIGVLRTFIPQDRIKAWMARTGLMGNVFAALFGAVTPFCSCSSIPIFLSFVRAGMSLGVALSFLIASPLINEYLVVIMLGTFGWKITAAYVLAGLFVAVVAGVIIGRLGLERYLVADMLPLSSADTSRDVVNLLFRDRLVSGWNEAFGVTSKIWLWVLAGVALGAFIHNYVPQETVQSIISRTGFMSVPLATLLGIPMYGSCAAIVPVALVLFQKGIPLGTALAFMMAISALSLPEAIMLRRAMKLNLILIFFGVVTAGIMITGYLLNGLQNILPL